MTAGNVGLWVVGGDRPPLQFGRALYHAMLYFPTMFGLNSRQLFLLLMLVALLFVGSQYVPPYFTAFEFNDFIRQEVKFAATSRKTTEKLRADIVEKAKELGVRIAARDIRITRRGPSFTLELEYRFPIDLKIYRHELVFHSSETGEIFENAGN